MRSCTAVGGLGCLALLGIPLLVVALLVASVGALIAALVGTDPFGGGGPGGVPAQANGPVYAATTGARPTIHDLGLGPSDAARIARFIASMQPDSPLVAEAGAILALGQRFGIDPLLIVVWKVESQMDTVGLNVPGNGGNLIWAAMAPYAAAWGCGPGPSSLGHHWGACPSIDAGLGIWFAYVADYYPPRGGDDFQAFAGIYNPCADLENARNGFPCGASYAGILLGLLRDHAGPPTLPAAGSGEAAGGYVFPLVGYTGSIELHWGSYPGASDLFAPIGTPLLVMRGGRVEYADYDSLGGWAVLVAGDDGLRYWYAHLRDRPLVGAGTTVATGQPLGFLGASGNADGGTPHLHLGIGPQILTGSGPTGGAGSDDYDAVGLLRRVYACCVRR